MSQEEYDKVPEIVVVKDEGVFGIVVNAGPHVSTVLFCVDGLMYEEIMENEDFEVLEVD